ncbi:hypothetical protein Tco_1193459, partial [Tanacetum coccineum]
SISTWEDLTTRFLAQFFPPGRTVKLHNDNIKESLSLKQGFCEIDRAADSKLHDKNADESWEIIENLALYDQGGWNDSKDFVKPVKAISTASLTYVPQAYVEAVSSNPHPRNVDEPPRQNSFTFHERVRPNPQPQALGTNSDARVRDYMAAHIKRMEMFENSIFNPQEEINDKMTEMFELLKELITSKTPEKEEKSAKDNAMSGDSIEKPDRSDAVVPLKEVKKENEAENKTKNELVKSTEKKLTLIKEEESVEAPISQPVGYYLKHKINKKLV